MSDLSVQNKDQEDTWINPLGVGGSGVKGVLLLGSDGVFLPGLTEVPGAIRD